jgi:hypothetical protein
MSDSDYESSNDYEEGLMDHIESQLNNDDLYDITDHEGKRYLGQYIDIVRHEENQQLYMKFEVDIKGEHSKSMMNVQEEYIYIPISMYNSTRLVSRGYGVGDILVKHAGIEEDEVLGTNGLDLILRPIDCMDQYLEEVNNEKFRPRSDSIDIATMHNAISMYGNDSDSDQDGGAGSNKSCQIIKVSPEEAKNWKVLRRKGKVGGRRRRRNTRKCRGRKTRKHCSKRRRRSGRRRRF